MKKNYFILLLIGLLFFAPISLFSQVRYSMLREYVSRGNLDACVQLAILLWNGDGVKQDRQEALALFNQAADGGNASAFFLLGHVMDAEGNQEKAFENYKKAADAGLMDAINTVAYRYANGQGTEQSYEMAHQYIDTILNAETVPDADKAMYYDSKGEFYLMNKEWGKAKEMLDKALEMNPSLASEKTVLYQAFYSEDSELAKERLAAEMAEANRHAAEWAEEERLKAEEAGAKRIAQEKDNKTEIEAEKNTTETIAADGVVSQKSEENLFAEEKTEAEITRATLNNSQSQFVRKGSKLLFADTNQFVTSSDFTNSSAWQQYEKGSLQMNRSNYMFIASGVGLVLGGAGLAMMMGDSDLLYSVGMVGFLSGLAVTSVGAITGLILRTSGKTKIEKAMSTEISGYTSTVSFGLQQSGVGIALNF